MAYTEEDIEIVMNHLRNGMTYTEIRNKTNISRRTIKRWEMKYGADETVDPDSEIVEDNVRLAKRAQKFQDTNRIERKSFREYARVENAVTELNREMLSVLKTHRLNVPRAFNSPDGNKPVGLVQISDMHLNEIIRDVNGNMYDMKIASQRLQKFRDRIRTYMKAEGVEHVIVTFLGDLINSDRRLEEVLAQATNRANALFVAVDLLQQFLTELAEDFNVTVASVIGNESRINPNLGWSNIITSDSFDLMIHRMLEKLFETSENVAFVEMKNPMECVIQVNDTNILLMHGHSLSKSASPAKIESEMNKTISRYAAKGVIIHFVMMGHIHNAHISDRYSRTSSLCGTNAFADKGLNLTGKASQNMHVVRNKDDIISIKVDLQEYTGYEGYEFVKACEAYTTAPIKASYIINSIVI